jgi:hypothetical protein
VAITILLFKKRIGFGIVSTGERNGVIASYLAVFLKHLF